MSNPVPIEVLLVEDDPGDVLMTREAFAETTLGNRLHVVTSGVDAMASPPLRLMRTSIAATP